MDSALFGRRIVRVLFCALISAMLWVPSAGDAGTTGADIASSAAFVKTSGTTFTLAGRPFFVAGVNNHYLPFGTKNEVIRVLDDTVALGANVVRTFLQPVIASPDGSVPSIWPWKSDAESSNLGVNGTYLLYWNASAKKMSINDGPDGMEKIDFLIAEAKERNLRLIIAFLDFWRYTGGAQQMGAWYGIPEKSSAYFTDPRTKQDYKLWVSHVLERKNSRTGLRYRDDPTIMAWELMNEPNAEPDSVRQSWAAEMSVYVKSLDLNHLVSSGHANGDIRNFDLPIASIDFGAWHGYPIFSKLSVSQFDNRISEFCARAVAEQKPVLLEEFGYARSNPDQVDAYTMWLNTLHRDRNCAGWLVWRLVSRQESGRYPVDEYDKFDIRNDGSPIWNALKAGTSQATTRNESRTSGP